MSIRLDLSLWEQETLGLLRQADELWLPLWELARRAGCGIYRASAAVRGLRARGMVVTRRCPGMCRIEVSLARSGL